MPARARVTVTGASAAVTDIARAGSPARPTADASFSGGVFSGGGSDFGTSATVPAALLDGVTASGGWSDRYSKAATQTLPEITNARSVDWVSVSWPAAQTFRAMSPYFTLDAYDQLPAAVRVSYWNGLAWVPVRRLRVTPAQTSDQPSAISFAPVSTTAVRLSMTSRSPGSPVTGNLAISELEIPGSPATG
jgi:beta-galactosidase